MSLNSVSLVDEYGHPFSARLHGALTALAPQLQRQFPTLRDEYAVIEILEATARQIVARERTGPVDDLPAYAWVVARHTATERLRQGAWKVWPPSTTWGIG